MTPLLEVQGLRVAYGGVVAVHDVSFTVEPGATVAVLGANGAGKTTVLRAISGLVAPQAGSVRFDGHDLVGLSPDAVARLGVAHVPAGRALFGSLSVLENLRMGLYGAGRDAGRAVEGAVGEVFELFPILAERKDQPAGTLSGGQQQMLVVGRALVQQPRLLMLDEMSMGLAPAVVADLFSLVGTLRTRGVAVVMVEQFVGQALAVADAAVVLEQGRVVAAGAADDLAHDDLAAAYLGREIGDLDLPPPPGDVRERVAVDLDARRLRALERLAAHEGVSASELAGQLLAGQLGESDGRRPGRASR